MFTGKLTSKSTKYVQTRPAVQNQIMQRIVDLKNSGLGFRMISRQLDKEGLAKMSKSTVENRWKRAQNLAKSAAKNPFNNPKLNALGKQEAEALDKLTYSQRVTAAQQRIEAVQIQRSEIPEGLESIFKTKKELKVFTVQTLYDSPVLKAFKLHCKTKRVSLSEAIAKVVGSLDEYVAQQEDGLGQFNLAGYIEDKLENHLKREKQEQLQKRFQEHLLNFKCSNCGRAYLGMYIVDSRIVCSCGHLYKPPCEACGNELDFDNARDVFVCRKCHATFRLPTLKPSDFTFVRETS